MGTNRNVRGAIKGILGFGVDIVADILGGAWRALGALGCRLFRMPLALRPAGRIFVVLWLLGAVAVICLAGRHLWPHPRIVVIHDGDRIMRLEKAVIDVVDGDTFKIAAGETRMTIRLYGIDCPETKKSQPFGQEARDMAAEVLEDAETVTVISVGREKYGRTMAVVGVDDAGGSDDGTTKKDGGRPGRKAKRERLEAAVASLGTLQEVLVKNGLAWVYDGYCAESFCDSWRMRQKDARAARAGLWADRSPTPPWEWREAPPR